VREDESLEIGHTARDTIRGERTSTNQFEIAIKNKGRFGRNSNNSIKGGLVLNKTMLVLSVLGRLKCLILHILVRLPTLKTPV
jgi:hypothetical protein